MANGARPRGGALGRLSGAAHIINRLKRAIGAHVKNIIRAVHAADPIELSVVELDLFASGELIEINGRYWLPAVVPAISVIVLPW